MLRVFAHNVTTSPLTLQSGLCSIKMNLYKKKSVDYYKLNQVVTPIAAAVASKILV